MKHWRCHFPDCDCQLLTANVGYIPCHGVSRSVLFCSIAHQRTVPFCWVCSHRHLKQVPVWNQPQHTFSTLEYTKVISTAFEQCMMKLQNTSNQWRYCIWHTISFLTHAAWFPIAAMCSGVLPCLSWMPAHIGLHSKMKVRLFILQQIKCILQGLVQSVSVLSIGTDQGWSVYRYIVVSRYQTENVYICTYIRMLLHTGNWILMITW